MTEFASEKRPAVTYSAVAVAVTMVSMGAAIADAFAQLETYLGSRGINPTGPPLVRYRAISFDSPFTIEVGWETAEGVVVEAPYVADVLPAGTYVVAHFNGPYSAAGEATQAAIEWAAREGIALDVFHLADSSDWSCWYESYPREPTWGPSGPQGPVDICLLALD